MMKYVPICIKPAVGFFSIGVHRRKWKDWINKSELQPDKLKSIFPENVLNTSNFIIEEFIRGEEYAIDYYDNNGDAVLLNVLHHLFSLRNRYKWSGLFNIKAIIEKYKIDLEYF
jgi:hypothetical protein